MARRKKKAEGFVDSLDELKWMLEQRLFYARLYLESKSRKYGPQVKAYMRGYIVGTAEALYLITGDPYYADLIEMYRETEA